MDASFNRVTLTPPDCMCVFVLFVREDAALRRLHVSIDGSNLVQRHAILAEQSAVDHQYFLRQTVGERNVVEHLAGRKGQ